MSGSRPGLRPRGENMKRYAPLLTLAAAAALGAGFLIANTMSQRDAAQQSAAALVDPAAEPSTVVELGRLTPVPAPAAAAAENADTANEAVAEKAYAGWTSGREASVAIAVKDGRAVGYVCDGKAMEAWLEGTLRGDQLTLESKDGSARITGTADGSSSAGTVKTNGEEEWSYTAEGVASPAGLYEGRADVRGVATRVGWVVTGDGEVTGVASAAGERRPAPALNPARPGDVTIDGAPVEVTALDGGSAVIRR
jgi:hypothetical protein